MTKPSIRRFFPNFIDRSLRAKITLGIILPMIIMLGTYMYLEYTHHRSVLLNNLSVLTSYNGALIKETLHHSMLVSDFDETQRILDAASKNENFTSIYLLNTSSRVIFAPGRVNENIQLDNQNNSCQPCHKLSPTDRPLGVLVANNDGVRVFRSMQPIENTPECSRCHDQQQKLIGLLLTDISVEPFEAAFVDDLRENAIWGISTIFVSAIIAYSVMGELIIRRLKRVATALARFRGNISNLPISTGSKDEIGHLEHVFDEMGARIQAEEAENISLSEHLHHQAIQQQELLKRLITAQEDERKRVARELHDELGQSLSGLALYSEVMEQYIVKDPRRALAQLSMTRELIGKTTQQMYELIMDLRPSVLDDLGLEAALNALAERVLNGVSFKIESSGLDKRLPAAIETALYRIFQEALSNVVRHSKANRVLVRLSMNNGRFEGEVMDNGIGFNLQEIDWETDNPHGLGLLGMQERLTQLGGSMEIITHTGMGTRIIIQIPMEQTIHG